MKTKQHLLAITVILVLSCTSHAAYDTWFTLNNHPDGNSHTAYVLHDGTWNPAGAGAYTQYGGIQAIWIDGFHADNEGWAKEALDKCFAMAILDDFEGSAIPRYIEKFGQGTTPIGESQWTVETRSDDLGNSFTSHYLKHRNAAGWEWYDYAGIYGFETRKAIYFASLWAMAFEPVRDATALSEDEQLADVKRTISTAKATWSYGAKPTLGPVISGYINELALKTPMEATDVEDYLEQIGAINGNNVWTQTKDAISALSLLYDGWSFATKVSTGYQVSKLYHQLVVLPEVEDRISEIEALVAANPAYDPALNAAVTKLRSDYDAMLSPTSGGSGPLGWITQELAFLQEMHDQHPEDFNKMVRDGIKLTGSSVQFIATVVAGVSLTGPQAALVAGAFILWDAGTGLFAEYEKMNTCQLLMNLEELLHARLLDYKGSINFSVVDFNVAHGVCVVSSLSSYCGYRFYELLADVTIDPDSGLYYWMKFFYVQQEALEYRQKCLDYAAANLCVDEGIQMDRNLYWLSRFPDGDGWDVASYVANLVALETLLVCDQPKTTPTASIQSISPSSITQGEGDVTFDGSASTATTPGTSITTYRWTSSIDGELYEGGNASFNRDSSLLSAGQHTISLQVRDSDGLWSENSAQAILYSYEPGPDEGHDLRIDSITLYENAVDVNDDFAVDVMITNDGDYTEDSFTIHYTLKNETGGVMDQDTESAWTLDPGHTEGPGWVYLDPSTGYEGPVQIEITISTPLDEDRANHSDSRSGYVGAAPSYEVYSGSTWYHVGGDAPATEDGYEVSALYIGGGKVTFSVTKGSFQQDVSLTAGEYAFVDSNRLLLFYRSYRNYRVGDTSYSRFLLALLTEDSGAAWITGATPTAFEGEDGTFNIRYRDSTTDTGYVLDFGFDGATVAQWPSDADWISYTEQTLTLTPSVGNVGLFKFWIGNWRWGSQPYVSYTTRSDDAVNFSSSMTVLDDLSPNTGINSGPSGTVALRDASFTYGGSDDRTSVANLTYSYRLVGHQDSWSGYSGDTSKGYTDLPNGTYTFEVKAQDGVGQIDLSPAQREFTVDIQNPPATPANQTPNHLASLRRVIDVGLLGNDFSDPDSGASHTASEFLVRTDAGTYTTPAWNSGTLGVVTTAVIPAGDLSHGDYWWKCRYRDNTGRWSEWSGETSFTILVNHAPSAGGRSVSVGHDQSVGIALPASDPNGDPITCSMLTDPTSGGAVVSNGPLSATYTPPGSFVGTDTFTYQVSDGLLDSSVATVTVDVVNHAPYANTLLVVVESGERTTLSLPGGDADGDDLTYAIEDLPDNGTLYTDDLVNGNIDYQSTPGFNADDVLTYSISDGIASDTGTVNVVVSDPNNMTIELVEDALGRLAVKYPAIAGYTYRVQYCNALSEDWQDLASGTVGDGTMRLKSDTSAEMPRTRMYRMIIELP